MGHSENALQFPRFSHSKVCWQHECSSSNGVFKGTVRLSHSPNSFLYLLLFFFFWKLPWIEFAINFSMVDTSL